MTFTVDRLDKLIRSTAGVSLARRHSGRAGFPKLGPGLITGESGDDPSGIATYSQVGAQFGYGMLWTMVISYPLMAAIQEISGDLAHGEQQEGYGPLYLNPAI